MQRIKNEIYFKDVITGKVITHNRQDGASAPAGLRNCKNLPSLKAKVVNALYALWHDEKRTFNSVTVEDMAITLGYKSKFIKQVFADLNLDGILSQKRREYAHDTDRNPLFHGQDSGWAANSYKLLRDPTLKQVKQLSQKRDLDH